MKQSFQEKKAEMKKKKRDVMGLWDQRPKAAGIGFRVSGIGKEKGSGSMSTRSFRFMLGGSWQIACQKRQ